MHNAYQKFIILPLALLIAFSPSFSYAKEKESREERNEKKEQVLKVKAEAKVKASEDSDDDEGGKESGKERKSCVKAFGRLIAPGYIKNKGEADLDFWRDCVIPFGILKKLNGLGTTTPPTADTLAPVISNISIVPKITEAAISWRTNERADTRIYWSASSTMDLASSSSKSSGTLVFDHRVLLKDLSASTTYYVVVSSKDKAGNVSTSSQMSFTTKGLGADVTAPVISNLSASAGTTTVAVSWNTNENATSRIYWSPISPLDVSATTTASSTDSALTQNHAMTVSGLAATTTYYFKVESSDAGGNTTGSSVFSATTR